MKPRRFTYLATSALFVFFLIYTTPHRVHHFFDQQASHGGRSVDHAAEGHDNNSKSPDSSCVFHLATKSCHLSVSSAVHIIALPIFLENLSTLFTTGIVSRFVPNAFPIRAPPTA